MLWAMHGSCMHREGHGSSLILIRNEVQAREKKKKKTGNFGMVMRKTRAVLQFLNPCLWGMQKIFQQNLNPGE